MSNFLLFDIGTVLKSILNLFFYAKVLYDWIKGVYCGGSFRRFLSRTECVLIGPEFAAAVCGRFPEVRARTAR